MTELDLNEITAGLHPLEIRLLRALDGHPTSIETDVAQHAGLSASQFRRAAEWLLTKSLVEVVDTTVERVVRITEMGEAYAAAGTPEDRIVAALSEAGNLPMSFFKTMESLPSEDAFRAIGQLKKKHIMAVEEGSARLLPGADVSFVGKTADVLKRAAESERLLFDDLNDAERELVTANVHKRLRSKGLFWIEDDTTRRFALTEQGTSVAKEIERRQLTGKELSRLTPDMLADGSWRSKSFRRYNINLAPPRIIAARKHPYRQYLDQVKQKLLSMGFEEMCGPLVETEFWNMDALFMPQFHSARDIHDVYFIGAPSHAKDIEGGHLDNVAACHETGGNSNSRGWGYAFDRKRTKRLVLRSQGTAISARTLGSLPKVPGKYFAMARCFRYDTVDATHACDFLQVEGIALGTEIDFRTLLGLLKLFAIEMARSDEVMFTPAYFPFTEPSVEAHIKHPKLGWMELGGAGIFRPEVTAPFGIDVPVLAWGLGLDRMAMVALEVKDIRELFSRDLETIRSQRIAVEKD